MFSKLWQYIFSFIGLWLSTEIGIYMLMHTVRKYSVKKKVKIIMGNSFINIVPYLTDFCIS